jgi:crossover junction endodeoxyribonuclease RusA
VSAVDPTAGLAVYDHGAGALTFHVLGQPTPQGSSRHVGGGRIVTTTPQLDYWRSQVAASGRSALADAGLATITGPVGVGLVFRFGPLAATPQWQADLDRLPHGARPDLDKLERAVLDGLTFGGVYNDDGQVDELVATKARYPVGWTGVTVTVWRVPTPERPARARRGRP